MQRHPTHTQRRSVRLKAFDYAQPGAYFVTICADRRACFFGQIQNGAVSLSTYGSLVEICWRALPHHSSGLQLDAFVVMPNHLHGLVIVTGEGHGNERGREGFVYAAHDTDPSLSATASSSQPLPPPRGTKSDSLGAVIQNFKSVSTRKINQSHFSPGQPVWQRNYYEHVVRDEDDMDSIREYIANNPAHWDLDEYYPKPDR